MASADEKSPDADDALDSPANIPAQPHMSNGIHSAGYSGMPMHMYPFPPGLLPAQPLRSKRRQVKNACTNCQKACKKCDDARPCLRCVKYGISEECVDSQRKERKKGIKRGPYKKRDGKGSSIEHLDVPQQGVPVSNGVPPPTTNSPLVGPYVVSFPPAGYFGQYAPPTVPKPGDGGAPVYPQYYVTHVPSPMQPPPASNIQEGDAHGYAAQPFYPTYVASFGPPVPYPSYVVPRTEGPMSIPPHYGMYGSPNTMYQKHPSGDGPEEMVHNGNGRVIEGHEGVIADK